MWVSTMYVWMWNGMLSAWYDDLFASLPFCLLVCYAWPFPLQWSSTWLMWADVRTPGSGDGNRNVAAWWMGQVLGPLWGPLLEDFILFMFFLSEQGLIIYLFSFQYISNWAMWGPFLVIWVYLTHCIPSYHKPHTFWIFMYVMFY